MIQPLQTVESEIPAAEVRGRATGWPRPEGPARPACSAGGDRAACRVAGGDCGDGGARRCRPRRPRAARASADGPPLRIAAAAGIRRSRGRRGGQCEPQRSSASGRGRATCMRRSSTGCWRPARVASPSTSISVQPRRRRPMRRSPARSRAPAIAWCFRSSSNMARWRGATMTCATPRRCRCSRPMRRWPRSICSPARTATSGSMRWPNPGSGNLYPSVGAAFAAVERPRADDFYLDYGIRPETLPQVSFADVLQGRVDARPEGQAGHRRRHRHRARRLGSGAGLSHASRRHRAGARLRVRSRRAACSCGHRPG